MPEDRTVPENMTMKELVLGVPNMTWDGKIDEIRSEKGAYLSLVAGAASGDFSSQLTDTRMEGGILTGVGSLASAGIKFLLRDLILTNGAAAKLATITISDGAATAATIRARFIIVGAASAATVGSALIAATPGTTRYTDLKGIKFSSDVRIAAGTGPVHATIGGIRLAILV